MRIKRGQQRSRRHKEVLKQAKGYRMSYSRLIKRAKEAVMHAGQYSMSHRRHRRAQMRHDWIKVITAALSATDLSYSRFVDKLNKQGIALDRKVMAEMAQRFPADFVSLVDSVK